MNRKLFLFFVGWFLIFTFRLTAQDTWIQTYDPFPGWDNPSYNVEDVIVCSDGGYAVNGTFNGFNFQEEFKWGFVLKTDSDGNMEWAEQDTLYNDLVHSTATGMIYTSDDCIISVGYSPNFGTYLIKRDLEGNKLWRQTMTDFTIRSLDLTNDGNIILGGSQNLNIALRKIDEEGDIFWTQVYPFDDDYTVCNSIVSLQDDGYALTGYYFGGYDRNGFDVLVMKTDANGDSLWTRTYDASGSDKGNCVIESSNGNILVDGHIVDPGQSAGFLWLLDAIRSTIWLEHVSLETGYEHFSLSNHSNSSSVAMCNFADGTKLYNFDSNYNIIWESGIDSWAAEGDKGIKNIQDGFIGGGYHTYPNPDSIILFKTDSTGQVVSADYELQITNYEISCYPNPFNPSTTISYNLTESCNLNISIYNIKGQIVNTLFSDYQDKGNHLINWNGTDNLNSKVSSGVYFIQMNVKNQQKIKRVLLLK